MDSRYSEILAQLRRRFARAEDVTEVQAWLSSEGFDAGQIGTIVSAWLSDIAGKEGVNGASDWPVRIQGPHERGRFSTDAWGYLLGCRASGVLGPMELEQVIERLLTLVEGQVGLEDVRSLIDNGFTDGYGPPGGTVIVH
jgi:Smg protein